MGKTVQVTDILLLIYFLLHAKPQYLEAQHIWANMHLLQFHKVITLSKSSQAPTMTFKNILNI